MFKHAAHLLCALVSWGFCKVLAESEDQQCPGILTKDPLNPNKEVCLVELSPMLEHIANQQKKKGIYNETQGMLDRIAGHQAARDKHFKYMHIIIDRQLKILEDKVDLDVRILSLETSLLQARSALQCSLDAKIVPPSNATLTVNIKFEKYGRKLIYIEKHVKQNWFSAASKCREMGGKLASPHNETELLFIRKKIQSKWYWLDYTNLVDPNKWISLATGKEASFLKWDKGEPKKNANAHCVYLYDGLYHAFPCDERNYFICEVVEGKGYNNTNI
ncbi:hypothetical protein KR084_003400, partial [Drosophila pseudotakahashii]